MLPKKNLKSQTMFKSLYILLLTFTFTSSLSSQDSLSLKVLLTLGLEKNYSILIARNEEEITNNNLSYAKYTFFPTLGASGRQSNTIADSKQTPFTGAVREVDNAKSSSLSGAINLEWTVFDGFAMFVGYNKVKELSELGKLNTKMNVENLAAEIASEYYNLIQQTKLLESMRYGMKLSAERLALAAEKYKIGSFSKLEYLQAQVDFNADSSLYLRQEEMVTSSKIMLGKILAYNLNIPNNWTDSINIDKSLMLEELLKSTLEKNTGLLIASQNKLLTDLDIRTIRSRRYPSISLNAGYTYTDTKAEIGFAKTTHSTGITYGATLNWSIFNRLDNRRQMSNAKIALENSELEFESLKLEITSELNQVWNNYTNNLRILSLETQNLESARENIDIAMAKYRLGGLAGIEMREIQKNFLDASNRFITAQYLAKVAEITLKQISGRIEEYF
jgi:outer membrane protein TolC